jgi:tetrahydromethanopterin S-methyltransferase subunit F
MKKILINISLILLGLPAFCQTQKTVQLDSLVSVTLPADYTKRDTLGQQTYTASSQYGFLVASRSPNPSTNKTLKKERELNNIFKEYIRKVQASLSNGTVINDHDTIINKLEVRDFTIRTDTGSGVQLRKFRILYTRPVTYTFEFLYDESRQDVGKKEMDAFFNSIKTDPDLDGRDQYLTFGKWQGLSGTMIVLIISAVLIVVFVILVVRRKRRKDILLNDILNE